MIFLHIDVDNLWMYEKEFDISIHKNKELIYIQALPLLLNILRETRSKATFMIIGKDLRLKSCQDFCRKAIKEGHEIANHTWSHQIAFNKLTFNKKRLEITQAHTLITRICKKEPKGFRGPGYFIDKEVVTILKELNYSYDTSVLPGIGPTLMSLYTSLRGSTNKNKTFSNKHLPRRSTPYKIPSLSKDESLVELPISILPFLKLPIHSTFAFSFGEQYRKIIFNYIKSNPDYLLYLLHGIDLINIPQQKKNYPVITLRYSFEERVKFVKELISLLVEINGKPLKTSGDSIKKIL